MVTADDNHWVEGGSCPRWGWPGAQNAMFDRPAPDLQQEIEEDEEELARMRLRLAAMEEMLRVVRNLVRDGIEV